MTLRVLLYVVAGLAVLAAGCNSVGPLTGLSVGPEGSGTIVASVQPAPDATAPEDTAITVTFSRSVSTSGFEVETEPQLSLGEPRWSDDLKTVTVTPRAPLTAGILYNVRVRATDRLGAKMASDYTWSFTALSPAEVKGEGRPRYAERLDVGMDARVFTLFAAMLAGTREAPPGDPGSVRAAIRPKMAELPAKTVEPIRRFMSEQPETPEGLLASALALSPPPEFRETAVAARPGTPSPTEAAGTSTGVQQRQTISQETQRSQGEQGKATPQPAASPEPSPGASPTPTPTSSPSPRGQQSPGSAQSQPRPSPGATQSPAVEKNTLKEVLSRFYADADIADLWKSSGKAYTDALTAYLKEAPGALGRATEYARTPTKPGGRITILPNLLGQPGQGFLVQQGDRAILVVGSTGQMDRVALLRPFLRLLLGQARAPVSETLQRLEPLYDQVRDVASRNGYRSWPDVALDSLVDAVTFRLALTGDAVPPALRSSYARGLILVYHFSETLAEYDRGTATLVESYPAMLRSVNLDGELRRWSEQKPR